MPGSTAIVEWIAARRLMSIRASATAVFDNWAGWRSPMIPALLTSTSTSRLRQRGRQRGRVAHVDAVDGDPVEVAAVASSAASGSATACTCIPSRTSSVTIARPMPPEAPVTTADVVRGHRSLHSRSAS